MSSCATASERVKDDVAGADIGKFDYIGQQGYGFGKIKYPSLVH